MASFELLSVVRKQRGRAEKITFSGVEGQAKFTILIGKNGTGKSRFLGDLANTFVHVENLKNREQLEWHYTANLPFQFISYRYDDAEFEIDSSGRVIEFRQWCPL